MIRKLAGVFLGGVLARWREFRGARLIRRDSRHPNVLLGPGAHILGNCRIGAGVVVYDHTKLKDCTVGRHTYFGRDSCIHQCTIGSFCSVSQGVHIAMGRHPTGNYVSTSPAFYSPRPSTEISFRIDESFQEYLPVTIGNDVLIGLHSIIMDGVTIGHGAIIGAGSVVTTDIPPYAVAAGVPARVIRKRFTDEDIAFLLNLCWWNRDDDWIRQHATAFSDLHLLKQIIDGEPAS